MRVLVERRSGKGAGLWAPLGVALAVLLGSVGWSALASADDAPPPPPGPRLERLFAPLKEDLASLPPFLRDTDLSVQFRIYYLNQLKPDDTRFEALAGGG